MHKRVIAGGALALLLSLQSVHADDGAASIAAGGIVMKRESRIVMAKEVLKISENRVIVDYDFRNDSDQDITTEVAFPIPDYSFDPNGAFPKDAGFDDFKLWVDNKPVGYKRDVHALLGKHDVTSILNQSHIDIASLGHYYWDRERGPVFPDIQRLTKTDRNRLASLKVLDEDEAPLWDVQKKYYWSQSFPARGTVHIRHEYTPVLGSSNTTGWGYPGQPATEKPDPELAALCPTASLLQELKRAGNTDTESVGLLYVDFILTTANTWKTPIEDFTLIVERNPTPGYKVNLISFCWDGGVEKVDADHFSAHKTDFVPRKELEIGFIRSNWTNDEVKRNRERDASHKTPANH